MTPWTLGAIERGEQPVRAEELVALALLLTPPRGIYYFLAPSMPDEAARRLTALDSGE